MRTFEIEGWAPDSMPYDQQWRDQDNADKSSDAKALLCCNQGNWPVEMNQAMMITAPCIAPGYRLLL